MLTNHADDIYPSPAQSWKYSDFKNGSVQVEYSSPVPVHLITVQENTKDGWLNAFNDFKTIREDTYIILEIDFLSAPTDFFFLDNLQYFFIAADRILAKHSERKIALLVKAEDSNLSRIKMYFSMMCGQHARYALLYTSDSFKCYRFTSSDAPGKLMPLIRVYAQLCTDNIPSGYVSISQMATIETEGSTSDELKLTDTEIENCIKTPQRNDIHWADSIRECCKIFLCRIGEGLRENNKVHLVDPLYKAIHKRRKEMTFLAELCWFFNLQILVKGSTLFDENADGTLDLAAFQKFYLDTLSYSDGLLQILENSCQHSQQHSAYMTLRILETDRGSSKTDRYLYETIHNRALLYNQVKNMTNQTWAPEIDARYYMQIIVADDCCVLSPTENEERFQGILFKFIQNNTNFKGELPKSLEELFTSIDNVCAKFGKNLKTSEKINALIHHYGLSELKQVIRHNNGALIVSSPYRPPDNPRYDKQARLDTVFIHKDKIYNAFSDAPTAPTVNIQGAVSELRILFPLGCDTHEESSDIPRIKAESSPTLLYSAEDLDNFDITVKTIHVDADDTEFPHIEDSVLYIGNRHAKYLPQDEKIEAIRSLIKTYKSSYSYTQEADHLENQILLFNLRSINDMHLEIFAKFLFALTLDEQNKDGERRLFAIYFSDFLQEQSFLRLFSVFYYRTQADKVLHARLANTQIALCSTNPALKLPEVNLILHMKDWQSLFLSARRFAYCNLESAQNIYGQTKYLYHFNDDKADSESTAVDNVGCSLFPFDLFLQENPTENSENIAEGNSDVRIVVPYNCWFLQRICKLLNQDLQSNSFGLKIPHIHTYLANNVHIDSFYEAELLFHNIAYVWRFAYLLARHFLTNYPPRKNYLIVCYEAYSFMLAQYFEKYLSEYFKKKYSSTFDGCCVNCSVIFQEKRGKFKLQLPPELQEIDAESLKDFHFIFLCPIGTTLGTIHQMHQCINRRQTLPSTPIVGTHNRTDIVMILVGTKKSDTESCELREKYWRYPVPDDAKFGGKNSLLQHCSVSLNSPDDDETWYVSYFIDATTKWHGVEHCDSLDIERPFVHVDSTSTELNMVFPIKNSDSGDVNANNDFNVIHTHDVCSLLKSSGPSSVTENDKRFQLLEGCVYYGHMIQGANHFQYFIDLPKYYNALRQLEPEKKTLRYDDWLNSLRKQWQEEIYCTSNCCYFNIIVTPLRNGMSPLLKDLMDNVFEQCTHILQINFLNARRTDIRTKYGFIAKEFSELRQVDSSARLRILYVDDSIVTGKNLMRGLSLVKMLFRDYQFDAEIKVYSNIYVLINRSSRDTIQSFVADPDTDFHAFLHIAVPHYNTSIHGCPDCERRAHYKEIVECSSTNSSAAEFTRLYEKYRLRTIPAFLSWQEQQIMDNPSCFTHLCQYIYEHSPVKANDSEEYQQVCALVSILQEDFYDYFCSSHRITPSTLMTTLTTDPQWQDEFLKTLSQESLKDQLYRCISNSRLHSYSFQSAASDNTASQIQDKLKEIANPNNAAYRKAMLQEVLRPIFSVWQSILGKRAYRRLNISHKAYSNICLEMEPAPVEDDKLICKSTLDSILNFLQKNIVNTNISYIEKWENLHCAIKVLSRDFISRHHMVREAVFILLHSAADTMLNQSPIENKARFLFQLNPKKGGSVPSLINEDYLNKITPLQRYQMFLCIIHRLADMQSNYMILETNASAALKALEVLTRIFFTGLKTDDAKRKMWYYCPLPPTYTLIEDCENCIKMTVMSGDEENKSRLINDHLHHSHDW